MCPRLYRQHPAAAVPLHAAVTVLRPPLAILAQKRVILNFLFSGTKKLLFIEKRNSRKGDVEGTKAFNYKQTIHPV